jgi:hypothetical protein
MAEPEAGSEFFERMGPLFAAQVGEARENAQRQADVERLLARAEYEYGQMRRELAGLLPDEAAPRITGAAEPSILGDEADTAPRDTEAEPTFIKAA